MALLHPPYGLFFRCYSTKSSSFRAKPQALDTSTQSVLTPASAVAGQRKERPLFGSSPRVTRRHVGPKEGNPSGRLHGMGAAESEARFRSRQRSQGSAHVTHSGQERREALLAGQRLQPKSNPHLTTLLEEYLTHPLASRYERFCAEFARGPIIIMVSEHEMALRENEVQMAALRHIDENTVLPQAMAFHPLLFYERDSDNMEDGDALMVKRTAGTLAPEYSYKRNSAYVSVFTDVESLEAAVQHPSLRASGLDRLSFIGLTPSSLSDWATAEALQGDLTIYLNRWTPQEIRLSRSDVAQLFRAAAASGEDVGQLATDFTCAALKSTAGEGVTESWNNLQDKREEYIQTRRQLLKERRDAAMRGVPKQLAAEEAKDLDALASTVTGDPLHTKEGSQRRDTLQLSEMTLGEISPEVKLALIGVLVQRPEVLRAYAGETGGVVSVAIQSKDFSLSCTKLRAMCNYCSLHGVGFPRLQFVQIGAEPQELEGMEKYGKKVYERPQNWMQLGRMEEADGLLV